MDAGFNQATSQGVVNPLPLSWLGRADAPASLPVWAAIGQLSSTQVKNLLAQISYDKTAWNSTTIGPNNELGKYQISTTLLENYGLLAVGSNKAYGTDCVNYKNCWRQVVLRGTNSYSNYLFNCDSLNSFLNNTVAQEHLAYQRVYDVYTELTKNDAVLETDSADVVAGMIYVGWELGSDAAKLWRYQGNGAAAQYFNSGRYAINILSQ